MTVDYPTVRFYNNSNSPNTGVCLQVTCIPTPFPIPSDVFSYKSIREPGETHSLRSLPVAPLQTQ